MTDMEKETVADEILEETEQEAAEDMSQEQTDAQAAENQPDDKDVQTDDKKRFFGKKKDKKDGLLGFYGFPYSLCKPDSSVYCTGLCDRCLLYTSPSPRDA